MAAMAVWVDYGMSLYATETGTFCTVCVVGQVCVGLCRAVVYSAIFPDLCAGTYTNSAGTPGGPRPPAQPCAGAGERMHMRRRARVTRDDYVVLTRARVSRCHV